MSINVGEHLPKGQVMECCDFDTETGCPMNPQKVDVEQAAKGKKIVLFAVPGAFTPTCSAKHLPGFIERYDDLKARGVDEIWCLSVNDHFVMAEWGRQKGAFGKVRMLADGSAEYVKTLGLERDLGPNGMGIRAHRFAMVIEDGVVTYLGIEASGKFEVSNVEAILNQL